jgi:hypothetical protein
VRVLVCSKTPDELGMARVKGIVLLLGCFGAAAIATTANCGHEVSYYPSFYPQEIRVEPLDPLLAAQQFLNKTDPLHLYVGGAPDFAGEPPANLQSVSSLGAFVTITFNPNSPGTQGAEVRCRALQHATELLAKRPDLIGHAYPVTPYHADYLGHVDLIPAGAPLQVPSLRIRASDAVARALLSPETQIDAADWDAEISEVTVDEVLLRAGVGTALWLPPPWTKEGWFQAYTLLRPALGDAALRQRADAMYQALTRGNYGDEAQRLNLERDLVGALRDGCDSAVIGYRLRREYYNDEFSNGIENISSDSHFGFNSGVAMRTVKLKDFPWNGWLRVGLNESARAAWNPIAGFNDAAGRLVWSIVGDAAFLPIPYNSRWAENRAEVVAQESAPQAGQSVPVSPGAFLPQVATGNLQPLGPDKRAASKITYRVSASAFQDGTETEAVDLLYPYALAYRWGATQGSEIFDPEVAAATQRLRDRLAGVRVVRVDERALQVADLTFTYRNPIVEVYLNGPSADAQDDALIAPPWSTVPWHVLALMEAAVERKLAAFSHTAATQRGLPWLDLVRDKGQLAALGELIQEFIGVGYRPPALERFVSREAATQRWQAFAKFLQESGHLLVTNGPYRLVRWSPKATVLGVMRDFSYPIGIGTFDRFAYPAHAVVTEMKRAGDHILVATDVEMAVKAQRSHRPVRQPLSRETLRGTLAIRPVARYFLADGDGRILAAGNAKWEADGRFAAPVPTALSPGRYRLVAGVFLDGNTINPSLGNVSLEAR